MFPLCLYYWKWATAHKDLIWRQIVQANFPNECSSITLLWNPKVCIQYCWFMFVFKYALRKTLLTRYKSSAVPQTDTSTKKPVTASVLLWYLGKVGSSVRQQDFLQQLAFCHQRQLQVIFAGPYGCSFLILPSSPLLVTNLG